MANNISTYPYFSDGEVLTAENLNSMVRYLAEQPKSICRKLVGVGIVNGLEPRWENGTLTISPGTAVFPDGTVIDIKEELTYPYLYEMDEARIFSDKELPAEKRLKPKSLDNCGIVLVRAEKKSRTVCNQITCDLNHCQTSEAIEPRLVKTSEIGQFSHRLEIPETTVKFQPLTQIHANMNYSALMEKLSSCFNANRDILCSAMAKALEGFGTYFTSYGDSRKYIQDWDRSSFHMESVAADWKTTIHYYTNALSKLHMLNCRGKGTVVVPYYFLDFLQDMREAFTEMCSYAKYFVKRYGVIHDMSVLKDTELVISGENLVQVFCPVAEEKEMVKDAAILSRLVNRLSFMVMSFIGFKIDRSFKESNVKLVPFRMGSSLADRPIPFYYGKDKGLEEFWKAKEPWEDGAALSYHRISVNEECQILRDAVGTDMHFSLQGVYGMLYTRASKNLKSVIDTYGLPLTVECLDLKNIVMHNDSHRPKKGKNYYRTILSWLNTDELNSLQQFDIKKVQDPKPCKYREKRHETERERTMATKESLLKISTIPTLKKILEDADRNVINDAEAMHTLLETLSTVTPHQFKLLIKYWKDIELRNVFHDRRSPFMSLSCTKLVTWSNRNIAALSKFKDFFQYSFRPAHKFSNLRGVKESGTITLVCYKGKVVFPLYTDHRNS